MDKEILIKQLNADTKEDRLNAVRGLKELIEKGEITPAPNGGYTNNHVHTKYSFSPYSPSKAIYMAVRAGLSTVGIMDHDAINGAEEFIKAGEILGIATTIGFEIRTDWSDTPLKGRRINNPDQISNAYTSAHGIPHQKIKQADTFLSNIREARAKRNLRMVEKINGIVGGLGLYVDYEKDVLRISYAKVGGGVTERHLLFALTKKLIERYGKGKQLLDTLQTDLKISLGQKQLEYLQDFKNEMFEYDLLNVLKSSFIKDIYVNAEVDEAVPVSHAVDFIKSIGAIPSYCYLGDVDESPTGDKKAQKFEDDYLEEVMVVAKDIGFSAIAYMPSRNTLSQLQQVMKLCDKFGFMQISGEDINQPRQSFICRQLKNPMFSHLTDTTWALVGHEYAATKDMSKGLFAEHGQIDKHKMMLHIDKYKKIGIDYFNDKKR